MDSQANSPKHTKKGLIHTDSPQTLAKDWKRENTPKDIL